MDYDYSPTALKKIVYAGTQAASSPQGSRDLEELAELEVSSERLRRATERIGDERVAGTVPIFVAGGHKNGTVPFGIAS